MNGFDWRMLLATTWNGALVGLLTGIIGWPWWSGGVAALVAIIPVLWAHFTVPYEGR